jgi:hypothetical protein
MKNDVLERYRKMQEKFNLPQLNELKATFKFDLENFENIDQIRAEMSDQLFTFTEKVIEHIIVGNESFCCLFEQDMITPDERKTLFDLYKKVQVLKWENNLLTIKPNEKKTVEWIRKTWDLWNTGLEDELIKICKKMSENWSDLHFTTEKSQYHG